jgi:hypothetical protein
MSLMKTIYGELHEHALVETAEEFSTEWCWRSKHWFAVQKHNNGDFSIPVAINCLNKAKLKIGLAHLKRRKLGSLMDSELRALNSVKALLEEHLLNEHRIASVSHEESHAQRD